MACYSDAQMRFPERFVVSLLHDCQKIAGEKNLAFDVFTYHQLKLKGRTASLSAVHDSNQIQEEFEPTVIINASGACGDLTLQQVEIPSHA